MSLLIVDEKCLIKEGGQYATVVVASDEQVGSTAISELQSAEARRAAISWAQGKGLSGAGVSGSISVYPVDAAGNELTEIRSNSDVQGYRADIPVTAKLV